MENERPRQYFLAFKLEKYDSGKLKSVELIVGWLAVIAILLIARAAGWIEAVAPLLEHLK